MQKVTTSERTANRLNVIANDANEEFCIPRSLFTRSKTVKVHNIIKLYHQFDASKREALIRCEIDVDGLFEHVLSLIHDRLKIDDIAYPNLEIYVKEQWTKYKLEMRSESRPIGYKKCQK